MPDKFLEENLWEHIMLKHIPQIFILTFEALIIVHISTEIMELENIIRESKYMVGIAEIVSLMPESSQRLIFVTMYAKEFIPISILLATSIVQDGHGTLPLLACSRRAFVIVKLVNLIVGLTVEYIVLLMVC